MAKPIPLPDDAPLLTFAEVGQYLRMSRAAVRQAIDLKSDDEDELGAFLRTIVVRLSPHRRYVKRREFMEWLRQHAGGGETNGER